LLHGYSFYFIIFYTHQEIRETAISSPAAAIDQPIPIIKLSPIILNRTRTVSFTGDEPPVRKSIGLETMSSAAEAKRRRRSNSLVFVEPTESIEHKSDQAALPNLNADWVNAKGKPANLVCKKKRLTRQGAWLIHPLLILCLKIFFDIMPGMTQELSWTLTNIFYMTGSYIMFHWVRGIPFDFNAGAFDNLNMWEQIDGGDQYTPAKKYLLCVPIILFLISTHYTHYDLTYFVFNLLATLIVVIPKLPQVSSHTYSFYSTILTVTGTSSPVNHV
jgi:hypothetical protein